MIVDPRTTAGANYIAECLKASRKPQLFFKMVHRDSGGNVTSAPVYDTSEIKSYSISDSICNNTEYSVGNVPNIEFNCEVFSATDDTDNVQEMEVFFNPFDDDPATVKTNIISTAVGYAPSNVHTQRIGTYYCTGAYFYEGVMVFRGVDAVGLHTNAYWPDNDGLTYPVTARQLLTTALAWGGFKSIGTPTFANLDNITIQEQPVGYTIRQILEIICGFEGANLVHLNGYRDTDGVEYDFKVNLMYPGRYSFANLANRSIAQMWAYDTNPASYVTIHDSEIFSIKRLQKPIVFAGVQYAGTYYDGTTAPNGATYYLDIPQTEFINSMSNADIATCMNKLAEIYKGWNYFPVNMSSVSLPFVQHFDRMFLPDQNLVECVVTSTNLANLGTETIVTAGNTVPMNDYRYAGKGVSRYDKNAALLNRLYKYLYPGTVNTFGIGGREPTQSTYPNGQLSNYMNLYQKGMAWFEDEVRLKDASGQWYTLDRVTVQRADSVNTLATSGWYRVFQCDFGSNTNAIGYHSQFLDITTRTSGSTNNTLHSIRLVLTTGKIKFVDELSEGNANRITQIRYMTKGQYGYIDVYFSNSGGSMYSSTDLIARPYQYEWDPVSYTSVATSPTGETQQAIYSFSTSGHNNPLSEKVGGTLNVTGNTTLGGTLGVTGNTTLSGTLGVTGNTTLSSRLDVSGQFTSNGNAFFNGSATYDGDVYLHKNNYLRDIADHNYNIKQVTVQGIRDAKYLTTTGWYRIAECQFDSANNAIGRLGQFVEINVRSSLTALHSIKLSLVWNALKWVDELSSSNANPIKTIRYTTNASNKGFIDVYYDNGGNSLYLSADITARPWIDACPWTPVDWTSVNASPSGETIRTSYTFNGNAVSFGSGMDAHFGGEVYNADNQKLSVLTPKHITTANTLSSAGWYRAYKITFGSAMQSTGTRGTCIDFVFASVYSNSNNTVHRISLYGFYSAMEFKDETSRGANTTAISKIRYMTDGTGVGYIDVYYALSTANHVNGSMFAIDSEGIASVENMGFASIAAAPSGETVRAEYTFNSNYNIDDRVMFQSGEVCALPYCIVHGGVYASSKTIYAQISLPKRMDRVNAPTITAMKGLLSGTNGTADGSSSSYNWLTNSAYTISTYKVNQQAIIVQVNKSTAFTNITNSTPLVFYLSEFTLQF